MSNEKRSAASAQASTSDDVLVLPCLCETCERRVATLCQECHTELIDAELRTSYAEGVADAEARHAEDT